MYILSFTCCKCEYTSNDNLIACTIGKLMNKNLQTRMKDISVEDEIIFRNLQRADFSMNFISPRVFSDDAHRCDKTKKLLAGSAIYIQEIDVKTRGRVHKRDTSSLVNRHCIHVTPSLPPSYCTRAPLRPPLRPFYFLSFRFICLHSHRTRGPPFTMDRCVDSDVIATCS